MNQPETYLQSLDPVNRLRTVCHFMHDRELLAAASLGAPWVCLREGWGYGMLTITEVRGLHALGVMADVYPPAEPCRWDPLVWATGPWPRMVEVVMDYPVVCAFGSHDFIPGVLLEAKLAQDAVHHTFRARAESLRGLEALARTLGVVLVRSVRD